MDWWANIIATLSFILAIIAFWWAIRTFGKTKTHLAIELEVIPPISFERIFGALGPLIKQIIEIKSPDAIKAFYKFGEESFPTLRDELPKLVADSPILQAFWPSVVTWFSKSPLLVVTIRNEGVSDSSVSIVEIGEGSNWVEPEGRAIYFKFTDALPVNVLAGGDVEIWFPVDKIKTALDSLKLDWEDAQIRVSTSNKSKFFTKLSNVTEPGEL